MTKYTGHRETPDDLKTAAPSVFMRREMCMGLDKNPFSPMCCLYAAPSQMSAMQSGLRGLNRARRFDWKHSVMHVQKIYHVTVKLRPQH